MLAPNTSAQESAEKETTASTFIGASGEGRRAVTLYRESLRSELPSALATSDASTTTAPPVSTSDPSTFALDRKQIASNAVVRVPSTTISVPREVKLQEWEGQVQEVGRHYFLARLVDLTARETEETEEAELPISDVAAGERDLLVEGATFRWIIGYRLIDGLKERFSRVVIRRLPMWTDGEIQSADREAAKLHDEIHRGRLDRSA
jgi:hypothetical protein